jgi:ferredoxin
VLELRNRGVKDRRVYVACRNTEKGGVARKACSAACIGCGKCEKECPFGAIKVENNLAYIDFNLCKSCRKCEQVCPTGAIHAVNFPPRPARAPEAAAPAAPAPAAPAPNQEA